MHLSFKYGFIVLAIALMGCGHPDSTQAFYDRHPQYEQPPSYFDKNDKGDGQSLNERYSGSKDD